MKVSVITINKNNAEGLRRTILSVISQSFKDFEYIIVDGNSSDNSVSTIQELLPDSSVQTSWISEDDKGIYNAMNKGIAMSKGEYLLFLNSGDSFTNNDCLQLVFATFPTADIVNARCNVVNGNSIVWTSPYLPNVTLGVLYNVGIPHQSTFIKKSLFDTFGQYREDFRYNSDIAFWYKTILFGGVSTCAIDLIITNYDQNGISSIGASSEQYQAEKSIIINEGILPRVIPDYDSWNEYKKKMREFEWLERSSVMRNILRFIRKITQLNKR